jgi:Secretion system C-terminal sorting domain
MKRSFILVIAILVNVVCFAQRIKSVHPQQLPADVTAANVTSTAKTTAAGDTYILKNRPDTAAKTIYLVGSRDSGYVTGINYWGDKAFAERYDVTDSARNYQVIGVMAQFAGRVHSGSTHSVTFKVWDQGSMQPITGTLFFNGFPNNELTTVNVPATQIGIGISADTLKSFYFGTPAGNLSTSFFVGYSIDYYFSDLGGDTLGLQSTWNGYRKPLTMYTLKYNISDLDTTLDTVFNVQNATLGSDNIWYDNYWQNDNILNNLIIYPIVVAGFPTSTKGITKNNLTYYGCYPNPVANSTNVKFSLASGADVTIQLMDMSGRVLNTLDEKGLAAGEHVIPVNTTNLPAGEYLYLIRTSQGDGIAGKIVKKHP